MNLELLDSRFVSRQSSPSMVSMSSVAGVLLLAAAGAFINSSVDLNASRYASRQQTPGTVVGEARVLETEVRQVLSALRVIHEKMIAEAVELDVDAHRLLYANVWNLYA